MSKNKLFGVFVLFLLLLVVSTSFAADNNTIISNDGDSAEEIESLSSSDKNPVSADYYFNSSSENDGDGSIDNPYNRLTNTRLKTSSTIHLANGEYNLTSGKSLNGVTIIGEDAQNTILRYTGASNSGKFTVGIDNYLILQNITLIGFNIDVDGGVLQANNTIFKNAVAFATTSEGTNLVNSATNSFGGAIYAYSDQSNYETYLPMVFINNCTFINNTAEYGGAIYMNQGTIDIVSSTFIDNYAYNYGGAIASMYQVSTRIKDSKFINDYSINDAGGAIYIYKSTLSGNNVSVINCSATFGAGITALNSTIALVYFNAINNTAKYEGGAIYQMYNAISVTDSNFTSNHARNGGAIYIDDVEIFKVSYNNFENNDALDAAGAVYLMFNPDIFENKTNNYTNNKAKIHNDFYRNDNLILRIGDGNYTLFFNDYVFDGVLPSSYDLREYDLVTPVKDQQSGGNCWAFGSIAALESAILKASGEIFDLSEENMKNMMQTYSDYGWSGIETNNGGYDEMAIGYLTSWLGPVVESVEEYDDYSMLSPVLKGLTHIQNIVYLGRNTYTDNDEIKKAIMKYGAVSTGIYFDSTYYSYLKHSYYYYGSSSANHAVAIVGWDDNYSSTNFNYKPAGNGAWIVKNSWNENWGENGYFYVSYYDTRLAQVGIPDYSYAFVFNDTVRFDKNYQYDIIGKTDYLLVDNNTVWIENIFDSTDNELLGAVSTYFRKTTDWEMFVYLNDELAYNKNGTSLPGYHTIEFDSFVPISAGDIFKIVFKLTCDSGAEFAISEKTSANRISYKPGISFFSFDGVNWTDLYDYTAETEEDGGHYYYSQVVCIKAFTILYELKPSINLSVSNLYNKAEFTAIVHDQYDNLIRSGEVIFNIGGLDYQVKIENGKADFTHIFQNLGAYDVKVVYGNAEMNVSLDITRLDINLNALITVSKNNVLVNFDSLFKVNSTLNVTINGDNYTVKLVNGKASFNLEDLDFGYYNLTACVDDLIYGGDFKSNFNITIIKTNIVANDLITYYGLNNRYSITLKDVSGNPVKNRKVSFIVDGKSYVATTDDEGIATVEIAFYKVNTFKMNVMFFEDESYFASSSNPNVDVKSTIKFLNNGNYLSNSKFGVELLSHDGSKASRTQVNIIVNDVNYWIISDNDGVVSQQFNLNPGSYLLTVNNIETGESLSKIINVVNPIMENKDLSVFYGSNSNYQVRVYGEDGNPVGANHIVKMIVNGKTYDVKTDSNGIAKLKITFALKSYTVTSSYNGFKVSNKIVVKPILTAKNISKKKAKKIKFSAKLVNSNGKVVKGKKITFKVKGKTYKAKTNKKGVATISIKNLKVGKYKVTTKYGKSVILNTIKIRK